MKFVLKYEITGKINIGERWQCAHIRQKRVLVGCGKGVVFKMNMFVVIQQMLVLLVMMLLGYIVFQLKWLDGNACSKMSKIVVNVLNPCLIINGVLGKEVHLESSMLFQTLVLVIVYYGGLILISLPVTSALHVKKEHYNLYRLMMIFSNVGFMGIPVISSIYGKESILLIAFYNLGYCLLLYTYGIYLAGKNTQAGEAAESGVQWKKLINPGVVSCVAAIAIFASGVSMPDSVCTFFDYVGNAAVPLSMILIGASVAQGGRKEFFLDKKMYAFTALKMLVIPVTAALLMQLLPWSEMVEGVFILMLAMPVGSIVVMLATESGNDAIECTKGSIITTLVSVVTIPVVAALLTF